MNVRIFLGPTLSVHEARAIWDGPRYLPPVHQGELYRAAREGPVAIGIIDGYFQGVPAVWHKEILWAMTHGVHVFGAASMGALRAAELADFGMRGVGEIYADYRDGRLEDDDEVAVLHGPAELGYPLLTEALVNIRATVRQAASERVIDAAQADALIALAKSCNYRERDYPRLLSDAAAAAALDDAALDAFGEWLPRGRIDRKARDAVELLTRMRDDPLLSGTPMQVDYRFEHTEAWQRVVERVEGTVSANEDDVATLALEQLKLDGSWRRSTPAALLRRLLHFRSVSGNEPADAVLLARARDMLRRRHGLWRADDLALWMRDNGLDDRRFDVLIRSEANVLALDASAAALDAHVVEELQTRGEYARYLAQGRALHRRLLALGERPADEPLPPLSELMAASGERDWPDDIDAHARALGFADAAAYRRALARRHRAAHAPGEEDEVDESHG